MLPASITRQLRADPRISADWPFLITYYFACVACALLFYACAYLYCVRTFIACVSAKFKISARLEPNVGLRRLFGVSKIQKIRAGEMHRHNYFLSSSVVGCCSVCTNSFVSVYVVSLCYV